MARAPGRPLGPDAGRAHRPPGRRWVIIPPDRRGSERSMGCGGPLRGKAIAPASSPSSAPPSRTFRSRSCSPPNSRRPSRARGRWPGTGGSLRIPQRKREALHQVPPGGIARDDQPPRGEPEEAGTIGPPHQLQADDLRVEPPRDVEAPEPQSDPPRALIHLCDSPMIPPPTGSRSINGRGESSRWEPSAHSSEAPHTTAEWTGPRIDPTAEWTPAVELQFLARRMQ